MQWGTIDWQVIGLVVGAVGALAAVIAAIAARQQMAEARVKRSKQLFKERRLRVQRDRCRLTEAAMHFHSHARSATSIPLLQGPEWISNLPVPLEDVELAWLAPDPAPAKAIPDRASRVLPLRVPGHRYSTISAAIADIERPPVFDDRFCYRLLDIGFAGGRPRLRFCPGNYFQLVDWGELLALELLLALDAGGSAGHTPLRRTIKDPLDLRDRPSIPSINTLTIRNGAPEPTFFMHRRDASKVPVAGSVWHVVPAGGFQPSADIPTARKRDFDLWANMMREYAEELLGVEEARGSAGAALDYQADEPYSSMVEARRLGRLVPYYLGVGLEPLTLVPEILTAVVFDAEVFDTIFAEMVRENAEGLVTGGSIRAGRLEGIPFNRESVYAYVNDPGTHVAAGATLILAEQASEILLS